MTAATNIYKKARLMRLFHSDLGTCWETPELRSVSARWLNARFKRHRYNKRKAK
jgi:hypothetical protein